MYIVTIIKTKMGNFGQPMHEEFHGFIMSSIPMLGDLSLILDEYGVSEIDKEKHMNNDIGNSHLSSTKWLGNTIHISTVKI